MKPEDYTVPDEEIARCEELIMDKAKKRLEMERYLRLHSQTVNHLIFGCLNFSKVLPAFYILKC